MNEFDRANGYEQDSAASEHMARVYGWMFFGLIITALTATITLSTPLFNVILNGPAMLILFLVEIGVVIFLSRRVMHMAYSTAVLAFLGYAALNGITLSVIFALYTQASIASTFVFAAAAFGAMSVYGLTTKADLTTAGSLFFMGLIGIIIASVVNLFLRSPALYWFISYAGIAIFLGLTAYDTQKIKQYHNAFYGTEKVKNIAIMGALTLYLDFINLFLFLLRILGKRK